MLLGSCHKFGNFTRMLNLAQNQNKIRFFLIIVGAIIIFAITFGVLSLLNRPKNTTPPQPSIKPEVLIPSKSEIEKQPDEIKRIREKIVTSPLANENGDLVLYKEESYRIVYVPPVEIFFAQILKDPAKSAKKQAQDWFIKFGLKQSDLCTLPVRFLLYNPDIKKTNPNFSLLPDGC